MVTIHDAVFGHVIGDALGVPVEFLDRAHFDAHPVTTMTGHGAFDVPAGTWSDDSALTLALMDALVELGFNYNNIMRKFVRWYQSGDYTPDNVAIGMGRATKESLDRYLLGIPALECGADQEHNNGNGALMRIIPLAFTSCTLEQALKVCSLTHAHQISQTGCALFLAIAKGLRAEKPVAQSIDEMVAHWERIKNTAALETYEEYYHRLKGIASLGRDEIQSTGFVVHTMEAALWCLLTTDSYKECVLTAVNLGSDTDTTAAVAGGLAGIIYGRDAIPQEWMDALRGRSMVETLCDEFALKFKHPTLSWFE